MKRDHDVIIAGGGLNGPALALALAQAGLDVAVIDAAPARARAADDFDGRAYALALASVRLLQALGLWPGLADQAQPIRKVSAVQARAGEPAGPFGLFFDGAEIEEGLVGQMLEDRFLYRALSEAMDARGVTRRNLCRLRDYQADGSGVTLQLEGGETLRAALLVGADGRGSQVARSAGIRRSGWDYGQTALVAALAHSRPHEATAHQVFLPAGPLAALPLTGDRSSIVWSVGRNDAARIRQMDDAGFLALLRPYLGDLLGEITLAGPRFDYPLSLSLAQSYVADRMALVGDAAHGVHPIAGQGLNLGLRDVAALAECVVDAHRRGEDIGNAATLARYQGWRRFDATTLALGMDGVNRLFSNNNPVLRGLREAGMALVNAVPPARRNFMRQAAGLRQTPLPKLMSGEAL